MCEKEKVSLGKKEPKLNVIMEEFDKKKKNVVKEWEDGLMVLDGPYGFYVKKDKNTCSVPKEKNVENLTREECEELLKRKKKRDKIR